ncbi:MAG: universal stress protein [Desulfobacteraceae bacterium]|jgi:nucleotide-binding universal stress UspA family protein|nr:MAG: universal stress protein [Desulfobacteraceae bacterium]
MFKKILIGIDGSENAYKALFEAIELADKYGAELHSITVEEVPKYPGTIGEIIEEKEAANGKFSEVLGKTKKIADERAMTLSSHVIIGHEIKTIIEFIREHNFDLLVIGFMGRSALYERIMGSTCQSLVRLAPCSVLVVK